MNNEQWEALKERTNRHKPGTWEVWLFNNVFSDNKNQALAAAAPALLAEVERLRGWLMVISREAPTLRMVYMAESAIKGAEVPK